MVRDPLSAPAIRAEYDVAVVGAGTAGLARRACARSGVVLQALKLGRRAPLQRLARSAVGQFSRGRKFLDVLFRPAPGS